MANMTTGAEWRHHFSGKFDGVFIELCRYEQTGEFYVLTHTPKKIITGPLMSETSAKNQYRELRSKFWAAA